MRRRVHSDPPDRADAIAAWQRSQAACVAVEPGPVDAELVAACDVAYEVAGDRAFAAVVVVERGTWREVDRATWVGAAPAEYQPGRFVLREAGCLMPALEALGTAPDALLVDGHGIAHPRRFGLACHLGVAFDVPAIGCAKTLLCGAPAGALDEARGASVALVDGGEVVGAAVRTRAAVKPVYVSVGHRFDDASATALVVALVHRYRIPEPLRQAHHLSVALRAG